MHSLRRSRLASTVGSVFLTLAAVGGVVCILAVIASVFLQVSLIMFSTGSMSPTIPAGSVAVVRQVPAEQVRVGDVVTVDRPGELPITHRIVAIRPVGHGTMALTLRGDANREDDQAPYVVSHVRLVLASVPGAASVIVFASNPVVLGAVTIAAALLVGWAFWPRGPDDDDDADDDDGEERGGGGEGGGTGTTVGSASIVSALTTTVLAAALTAALAAPAPARADTTQTTVSGRYITLTSIGDADAFAALTPGAPVRWTVGVRADPPDPATITLGLSASGMLAAPDGLRVSVVACSVRWHGMECPGRTIKLLAEQPVASVVGSPSSGRVSELGTMPSTEQRWLAVDVTLPPGWRPGSSADLSIHAWGAGDDVQTSGPTAALAGTGSEAPGLAFGLAAAAVTIGVAAAAVARRRTAGARRGNARPR
ncbi:signal peptidase I [Leifsonia sp. Le1]|uniref:signal peptidase I n=1 Tax=Leifsonia sp. Le1 TaxID=3404918 RepID=UPI003EBC1ECC